MRKAYIYFQAHSSLSPVTIEHYTLSHTNLVKYSGGSTENLENILELPKTINVHREKFHFPRIALLIREWEMSCEQCIRESRIDHSLTRPPLQYPNEYITAPEDAMQNDLVPGLPPSGDYEKLVTAMDVLYRFLFAYPTSKQDAKATAKYINNIMTKHDAYLPTTLIPDKGTAFMSHLIKEVAGVLGITLKHATTRHAETIGLLERSHASIKQAFNIEAWERRSLGHKYGPQI